MIYLTKIANYRFNPLILQDKLINGLIMDTVMPSIFNDVLGPVMRGPSSSHTAGSHRIGRILRDLARGDVRRAVFRFHPGGSLASTYHTQGSDIGLAAGLAGLEMTDPGMPEALSLAREAGINLEFRIEDYPAEHPNTYDCTVYTSSGEALHAVAWSVGGGMIRLRELLGIPVDYQGDQSLLLCTWTDDADCGARKQADEALARIPGYTGTDILAGGNVPMVIYRYRGIPTDAEMETAAGRALSGLKLIRPVMPVPPGSEDIGLFFGLEGLLASPGIRSVGAGNLGRMFECGRSGLSEKELDSMMEHLIRIWTDGIAGALEGTDYRDRLIGAQSPGFMQNLKAGKLLPAGPLNRMIAYSSALMEAKSSMGVIIAAPTAGACGGLPGCLIGLADETGDHSRLAAGFWAAGLVGVYIAQRATFAAEVAGCQAETGAGAAMAAAGLVEMAGGTAEQAFDAASVALQNVMGLVCDPVANRVEIPCLGRNAAAAANALTSANMILGGMKAVIPLNETIDTMLKVGGAMPASLRCTALGGLSDTPTARRLERELNQQSL